MRKHSLSGVCGLLLAVSSIACGGKTSNPTAPTSNLEIVGTAVTTIGGRVISSAGSPISGVTIEVIRPSIDTAVSGTTDSEGVYRLSGLRSETFAVRFSHPRYESVESEFTFSLGTERLDLVNRLTPLAPTSTALGVTIYTSGQHRELAAIDGGESGTGIYLGTKDAEGLPLTISDAVIDGPDRNPDTRAWIKVGPDGKPESGVLGSGDRIAFEWIGADGIVKVVRPDGTTVQAPLKRSGSSGVHKRRADSFSGNMPLAVTADSACRALREAFSPTCGAEAELISTGLDIVASELAVQATASGQVVAALAWSNLVIWNHAYGQACELAASYVNVECAVRSTIVTAAPPPTPAPSPTPTPPATTIASFNGTFNGTYVSRGSARGATDNNGDCSTSFAVSGSVTVSAELQGDTLTAARSIELVTGFRETAKCFARVGNLLPQSHIWSMIMRPRLIELVNDTTPFTVDARGAVSGAATWRFAPPDVIESLLGYGAGGINIRLRRSLEINGNLTGNGGSATVAIAHHTDFTNGPPGGSPTLFQTGDGSGRYTLTLSRVR